MTNKPEVVGFATHHDEPMLFPNRKEAAAYCYDGEEPIALIRLSDYEAMQAEQVPDAIQLLQRVAASTTDKPAVAVPDDEGFDDPYPLNTLENFLNEQGITGQIEKQLVTKAWYRAIGSVSPQPSHSQQSAQYAAFLKEVREARLLWMAENPTEDGHDHVTPFDHFLYVNLYPNHESERRA